jgi:predicted nucleotide-binding protein (sugar kinase/HSP70/actin superfamily)
MIFDPYNNKFVHFGAMGYLDYSKYLQIYDLKTANKHRRRYLKRALFIKGNWMDNAYSPNYLSMLLLWYF